MNLIKNESGQGLTEYVVLLFLVCLISLTAVKSLGSRVKSKLTEASNHINSELTLEDGGSGGGSKRSGKSGGGITGLGGEDGSN